MKTPKIYPKKWYILDIRDPKSPRVSVQPFLFKEQAQKAIGIFFPNSSVLIEAIPGQELIDWDILPKYSAYRRYGFTLTMYPEIDPTWTRREKVSYRKRLRRQRRIAKFREMQGLKPGETLSWDGVHYDKPHDNIRWRLMRRYDHL